MMDKKVNQIIAKEGLIFIVVLLFAFILGRLFAVSNYTEGPRGNLVWGQQYLNQALFYKITVAYSLIRFLIWEIMALKKPNEINKIKLAVIIITGSICAVILLFFFLSFLNWLWQWDWEHSWSKLIQ
jgi:hypothetical protein